MSDKEIAKQAVELAEKEAQEKQVHFIKQVVQEYLERIEKFRKEEREAKAKREALEHDLDDIKAGRLDKVKERQEKNPVAKEVAPIVIRIVEEHYQPLYPWHSQWVVEWKNQPSVVSTWCDTTDATSGGIGCTTICSNSMTTTGTALSSFTHGTYNVGTRIVNL